MKLKFFASIIFTILCIVNSALAVQLNCAYSTHQCYNYSSNAWQDCSNCGIKNLDLSNEQTTVTANSRNVQQNKDIERLEITLSTLKFIPSKIYEIFPKMRFLYVQSNEGFEEIKAEYFRNAGQLVQFWAWGNELTKLDANVFQGSPNLEVVGVQSNSIKVVDKDAFKGLRKLEVIYMFNNMLKTLHRDTFKDNLLLREISIGANKFKILSYSTFSFLKKLTSLKLDGNVCIDKVFTAPDAELERQLVANCGSEGGNQDSERVRQLEIDLEQSDKEKQKLRVLLLQTKNDYKNLENFCQKQLIEFKEFEKRHCPTVI